MLLSKELILPSDPELPEELTLILIGWHQLCFSRVLRCERWHGWETWGSSGTQTSAWRPWAMGFLCSSGRAFTESITCTRCCGLGSMSFSIFGIMVGSRWVSQMTLPTAAAFGFYQRGSFENRWLNWGQFNAHTEEVSHAVRASLETLSYLPLQNPPCCLIPNCRDLLIAHYCPGFINSSLALHPWSGTDARRHESYLPCSVVT